MFSLEEKLRPRAGPHTWARDLFGIGLLLALAAILLPTLGIDLSVAFGRAETAKGIELRNHQLDLIFRQVTEQMASVLLLMSLGFLLCLRCGAVDLSVWVAAGLGGVVAAKSANAGVAVGASLAVGVAAGAAFGALNGVLVAAARLPALAVTLVTGLLLMWSLQACCDGRSVPVGDDAFAGWHLVQVVDSGPEEADSAKPGMARGGDPDPDLSASGSGPQEITRPLYVTRSILVSALYAACMLVIMAFGRTHAAWLKPDSRWLLLAALCASGALSAAGGALWLLDHNRAPVPTRLVDDLRVPAAAILAGGVFFAGKGRALLAAVCLPGALLLTGIWRQSVWHLPAGGWLLQLAVLAAATVVAQAAVVVAAKARPPPACRRGRWRARPGRRRWPVAAAALTVLGVLSLAAVAHFPRAPARTALHAAGAGLCCIGAALLAVALVLGARSGPAAQPPDRDAAGDTER